MSEIATLNYHTFTDWLDERDEARRNVELGIQGSKMHLAAANDAINRMISGERDDPAQ